ncbi:MAG TPA: GxxExxY protein [Polyangiaceae bacterium]|jgi:GxxExxY protein|nr:GxxExxY protein [Polyangiaceae bacterium]
MGNSVYEKTERSRTELDRISYLTIGAAIEVHRILGPGLLESIYEEALCSELVTRKLSFSRQVPTRVMYKQHSVGEVRLDLVVCGQIVLELKATDGIAPIHVAQLLSYLKATRLRLGLLINFNVAELRRGIKRLVLDV